MALGRRRARTAGDREATTQRGGAATAVVAGRRAAGSGLLLLARIVMLVAVIVAVVIALAILLRLLDANATNSVVKAIHDAGKALVGPFKDIFKIKKPKVSMAVNWGLAAVVYLVVGSIIARLVRRAALRSHPERTV
jgi:hypothetical protein